MIYTVVREVNKPIMEEKMKLISLIILTVLLTSCGNTEYLFHENTYDDTAIVERLNAIEANYEAMSDVLDNTINVIQLCEYGGEILFELGNGTFVSYFESGSNKYLAVLDDGIYVTTDSEACRFEIVNGSVEQ